jgi:hypothetical protein
MTADRPPLCLSIHLSIYISISPHTHSNELNL